MKRLEEHRQQLSMKFDDEIIGTHDQLLEQIYKISSSNIFIPEQFDEINQWEAETIDKVRQAAERTRQQLSQLLNETKDKLIKGFGTIAREIRNRREEADFDENDIDKLRQKLNEMKLSLIQLTHSPNTKTIIIAKNDQIDWNRLIHVQNELNEVCEWIVYRSVQ